MLCSRPFWLGESAQETTTFTLRAAAQQAPAPGAPAPQAAARGGFGGPIELGPDDKPAFPDPPAGFNVKRDNIPHGELTHVQYDSKTLGTRRRIRVYTPPGYSANRKYPVLYLLHGIGWNDLEWTRSAPRGNRHRQPAGRRQDSADDHGLPQRRFKHDGGRHRRGWRRAMDGRRRAVAAAGARGWSAAGQQRRGGARGGARPADWRIRRLAERLSRTTC